MKEKTRDRILRILRESGKCTVVDLAEQAKISPVSVRHHLNSLQAERLVGYEEERHGVGRPRMIYFLTERALEQYPTRYLRLTNRLLDQLKTVLPNSRIEEIMVQVAESMAEEYAGDLESLPPERRLSRLQEFLREEGFVVQIDRDGDNIYIHELTCPFLQVGQEHPEVCLIDEGFLSKALGMPIERVRCQLEGDARCTFLVHAPITEVSHE